MTGRKTIAKATAKTTPASSRKSGAPAGEPLGDNVPDVKPDPAKQAATEETHSEGGALRIAGVAEPIAEGECAVSGCPRDAAVEGLCEGHHASRRGDRVRGENRD